MALVQKCQKRLQRTAEKCQALGLKQCPWTNCLVEGCPLFSVRSCRVSWHPGALLSEPVGSFSDARCNQTLPPPSSATAYDAGAPNAIGTSTHNSRSPMGPAMLSLERERALECIAQAQQAYAYVASYVKWPSPGLLHSDLLIG